jgi:ABC-type bacteriocin/lantibiotic exporter with double-glycine peptidase domain
LELLNREKTLVELEDGVRIEKIKQINFKNVNFHYKADQPVLKDVNISFD